MRRSIVAIGGGQINNRDLSCDTVAIDRELVRMAAETPPRLLFVPTASSDNHEYIEDVRAHFGRLGCDVRILETILDPPSRANIESLVFTSSIIYVGGGDSRTLIDKWAELELGPLFAEAFQRGIVLSGLSAGAICWFTFGHGAVRPGVPDIVSRHGLGLVNVSICPHFNSQPDAHEHFWESLPRDRVGIGLDDCAAIRFSDSRYDILAAKPGARAVLCWWGNTGRLERVLSHGHAGSVEDLAAPSQ